MARFLSFAMIGAAAALVAGCASGGAVGGGGGGSGGGSVGVGVVTNSASPGSTNPAAALLNDGHCPSSATDPAIAKLKADAALVPLPADFQAVAAVRCGTMLRTVPGDGEWQFADAQRADSGLAALLTALRLPSQTPPTGDFACAAIGMLLPDFGLVDASGNVIKPRLPQTYCGLPLNQVLTALNALPWRTEAEQRLNQTQNQQEVKTGCYPQYKDVFELPLPPTPEPWSQVRHPASTLPPLACIYAVEHAPKGSSSSSGSNGATPAGDFVRGMKLNSARQSTIEQTLNMNAEDPAPPCTSKATRFAVFFGIGADGVAVELDGCQRVLWPNGFTSPAPAMLLEAIAGLGLH